MYKSGSLLNLSKEVGEWNSLLCQNACFYGIVVWCLSRRGKKKNMHYPGSGLPQVQVMIQYILCNLLWPLLLCLLQCKTDYCRLSLCVGVFLLLQLPEELAFYLFACFFPSQFGNHNKCFISLAGFPYFHSWLTMAFTDRNPICRTLLCAFLWTHQLWAVCDWFCTD